MSIKDKLTALLRGQQPSGKPPDGEAYEDLASIPQQAPEPSGPGIFNQSLLELSAEHQIYRLYNQRRQESGYLPAPRLCLDEDGALPPEMVQREKNRLRTVLTKACSVRLKDSKGRSGSSRKKKPAKGEEPEDLEEAESPENEAPILDALPLFFLSSDKLYAWVIAFPPINGGKELSRDMLYEAMITNEIGFGVDTRLADRLAHDERRYFNLYLIAKGKPAFDGKNGNIVDNFPRVIERVLEVDEFDQVDYTALNLIYNVEVGQEICHLIKPTEGEPGRTVLDQEIPAKSGKNVPLPQGRNTEISEDGTQLLASIAGSVEFTGRSFQVKPVLEISGNVDFSTGDLDFLGDINICGNVLSGFTVRAMGNIHIAGVVEAGSTIEAGGDLAVVKGILGDGTTTVQVHRSIFSKYVENATISVRENLQTDCIIGSSIYCGGEVLVQSGRGVIMGGRVWAAKRICAHTVGSQSECKTSIVLGGRPCASFEREITQREVNAMEMELERLECQPESPVKSSLLSKAKIKLATAEMKLRQLEERRARMTPERERESGRMECGAVYPGTKVRIGEEVLRVQELSRHCVVTMIRDEIVMM